MSQAVRLASAKADPQLTRVSIVLPCLNEAASVGAVVDQAFTGLKSAGLNGEVVVVDNGSTDGSADVAAQHGARVVHEPLAGYGAALVRGFNEATGDIIVMADADLTYPLERLSLLVEPLLRDDADIVYGGRLADLDPSIMPRLHRYVGTPALTFLLARACGGMPLRDSQSGFRAFQRSTILDLDLRSTGMELNAELLLKAVQAGLRIDEVATGYRARVGESKLSTFRDGWRNLRTILLLAPEMLLIWPGAALVLLGIAMTVAAFVAPSGIPIGSLRWQPVFFSSIALTVGTLGVMSGMAIASRSVLVARKSRTRYARFTQPGALGRLAFVGAGLAICGLAMDFLLLANWAAGHEAPTRGLAVAALAQSCIVAGTVLGAGAGVARILSDKRRAALIVIRPDEERMATRSVTS